MINIRCKDCTYFIKSTNMCIKYDMPVKQPQKIWNGICFIPKINTNKEEK